MVDPVIIEPVSRWRALPLREMWQARELLYSLTLRDVKVRYKQAALGVVWAVLQPLATMLVFTLVFGVLLKVPSNGLPYPLFALCGLVPWMYFSSGVGRASTVLVANSQLISKIYFPRLFLPIASTLSGLLELGIALVVLFAMLLFYGLPLTPRLLFLPLFVVLAVGTCLAVSLWLSALHVRYRDIGYLIPFVVQLWMYLTPVIYGTSLVPEQYRWLLALNPMTAVVGGFRWCWLGDPAVASGASSALYGVGVLLTFVLLVGGTLFFRRVEISFADIV